MVRISGVMAAQNVLQAVEVLGRELDKTFAVKMPSQPRLRSLASQGALQIGLDDDKDNEVEIIHEKAYDNQWSWKQSSPRPR